MRENGRAPAVECYGEKRHKRHVEKVRAGTGAVYTSHCNTQPLMHSPLPVE